MPTIPDSEYSFATDSEQSSAESSPEKTKKLLPKTPDESRDVPDESEKLSKISDSF